MCCVWILKSQRLNILLFSINLKYLHQTIKLSLQYNFIVLAIFFCGLLINSLFPCGFDLGLTELLLCDNPALGSIIYVATSFWFRCRGIRQLKKRFTSFGEIFDIKILQILGNISPTLFFLSSLVFFQSFSFLFTSFYC